MKQPMITGFIVCNHWKQYIYYTTVTTFSRDNYLKIKSSDIPCIADVSKTTKRSKIRGWSFILKHRQLFTCTNRSLAQLLQSAKNRGHFKGCLIMSTEKIRALRGL